MKNEAVFVEKYIAIMPVFDLEKVAKDRGGGQRLAEVQPGLSGFGRGVRVEMVVEYLFESEVCVVLDIELGLEVVDSGTVFHHLNYACVRAQRHHLIRNQH